MRICLQPPSPALPFSYNQYGYSYSYESARVASSGFVPEDDTAAAGAPVRRGPWDTQPDSQTLTNDLLAAMVSDVSDPRAAYCADCNRPHMLAGNAYKVLRIKVHHHTGQCAFTWKWFIHVLGEMKGCTLIGCVAN